MWKFKGAIRRFYQSKSFIKWIDLIIICFEVPPMSEHFNGRLSISLMGFRNWLGNIRSISLAGIVQYFKQSSLMLTL